jgi:hypothetical protein
MLAAPVLLTAAAAAPDAPARVSLIATRNVITYSTANEAFNALMNNVACFTIHELLANTTSELQALRIIDISHLMQSSAVSRR